MSQKKATRQTEMGVSDFYAGKSVFITGATGLVGSVMLEILLRCCPGIRSIYVLLRAKKGQTAERRMESLMKRKIYDWLRKKDPEALQKVQMIEGDVTQPSLGLRTKDLQKIVENVSIVFHCAANITFNKTLRFMLTQNVQGTQHVLELCNQIKELKVIVYTSTFASNCHLKELKEKVYTMPFTATQVLETFREKEEDALHRLVDDYASKWPNTYTFSKCVAENLMLEYFTSVPTVIIRPTLIGSCWKGSLPGYVEGTPGMIALLAVVAKGFVRVVNMPHNISVNITPADVVANTHIVGAWSAAIGRSSPFLVINCIDNDNEFKLTIFVERMMKMISMHPVPKAILEPSCSLHQSPVIYWIHAIIEHYIPALVIDTLLYVTGKKPKMFSLYRVYDKSIQQLSYFRDHKWACVNDNYNNLNKQLREDERETFYVDGDNFCLEDFFESAPSGASEYDWSTDKRSRDERAQIIHRRTLFLNIIKTMVLSSMVILGSMALSGIFRILY